MGIAAEETINDAAAPTDRRHPPTLIRHPLSRELCRRIGWFKPAGGLKDLMAWVPMLTDRPATARPNEYLDVGGRSELPVHR